MHRWARAVPVTLVLCLAAIGCSADTDDASSPGPAGLAPAQAGALAGDALPSASGPTSSALVADWMELHADLARRELLSPPVASRFFAYGALALHEGAARADEATSLAPELDGLTMPPPAGGLDAEVTATVAVSRVTTHFLPGIEAGRAAETLEREHLALRGVDSELSASVVAGEEVADVLIAWSELDGYEEMDPARYEPPRGPGLWEPTLPAQARALEPYWSELRPFLVAPDRCDVPPPVAYDPAPGSAFGREVMAVVDARRDLTDEEAATARYWNDRPGATSTPPGHWMEIAAQEVRRRDLPLAEASRTYAVVGMTSADAFIANWAIKYRDNVVRPITVIRAQFDADWFPLLPTPPFPEYPSGHSTISSAAAIVLTGMLGEGSFTDASRGDPRAYASFWEAAEEAAWSRLYGGIHYPMGIEAGLDQGRCLGEAVLSSLAD